MIVTAAGVSTIVKRAAGEEDFAVIQTDGTVECARSLETVIEQRERAGRGVEDLRAAVGISAGYEHATVGESRGAVPGPRPRHAGAGGERIGHRVECLGRA